MLDESEPCVLLTLRWDSTGSFSPAVNIVHVPATIEDPTPLLVESRYARGFFGTLRSLLDIIGEEIMPGLDDLPIKRDNAIPSTQDVTTCADLSSPDDSFDKVFDALNTKPPVTASSRRDSVMDL
jgi:hypothetical protein